MLDRASEEVDLAKSGVTGPLVVVGTPISMLELVPRSLALLDETNSRIQVSLVEADDDILLDKLRAGEIELMLGGMANEQRDLQITEKPLIQFPLQAVVGRQNALWNRESVALEELADHDWALPAAGSVIRSYVDAIFVSSGQTMPTGFWSCSSMHGLKSMIRHTSRVTLIPAHAISLEAEIGVLKGLKLSGPSSFRQLNIMRLRHLPTSTIAETFIRHLDTVPRSILSAGHF